MVIVFSIQVVTTWYFREFCSFVLASALYAHSHIDMEIGDESQDSITDDATDLESTPTVNDNANDNVHDKADAKTNEQDSRKY
jgi:hypothetical protein